MNIIFYIVGLICFFCLVFSLKRQTSKNKILFLVLCAIVFIIQMALREPTERTSDLSTYYILFKNAMGKPISYVFSTNSFEWGYYLHNWVFANTFGGSWVLFIVATYIFIYFLIFRNIYLYSDNIYMSVIMYVSLGMYGFSLTGIRQTIAMAICLWSFDYVVKKKFIPFILVVMLAFLFHKSAIVFVPAYFIGNLKVNRKNTLKVLAFGTVISFVSGSLMQYFNSLFQLEYGYERFESYTGRIIYLLIFLLVFLILLYVSNYSNYQNTSEHNSYDIITQPYIMFIGAIIYSLQFFSIGIATRISTYYTKTLLNIQIPNMTGLFYNKNNARIINACFIIFGLLLFLIGVLRNNSYNYAYIIG